MTVSGHREDQESEENRDPSEEEADSVSFVNSELGSDAAMALSLLGCLRELAVDLRPSLAGMGDGRFGAVDRSAVVRYLAALGGVAEPAVRAVLEWGEQQPGPDASPMARLDDVVERLRNVDGAVLDHLTAFQENVRGILEGEVLADAKLLSDDGSVFLRGLAALFRPKDMKYHSVVEFLDQQGGVGPRVRVLATVLSAVTTGGFKSIAGLFKTDRDLYALGCCIAAGQCHRVTIVESRGEQGFEIHLDGEVLDYFKDLDAMQTDGSEWQPLNLLAAAQHAGYDKPELVVAGQPELLGDPMQREPSQYRLPGNVIVEFDPDDRDRFMSFFVEIDFPVKTKRKPGKPFLEDLCRRLLAERLGGEVVLVEYPTVRLYRDHHGRDLNHEELVGHVDSLQKGAARLKEIYQAAVQEAPKKKAAKKKSPKKPDSKTK